MGFFVHEQLWKDAPQVLHLNGTEGVCLFVFLVLFLLLLSVLLSRTTNSDLDGHDKDGTAVGLQSTASQIRSPTNIF